MPEQPDEKEDPVFLAVLSKFADFQGWPGFPVTDSGVRMYARAFAKFCHNKSAAEISPKITAVIPNDIDWLMDTILETCVLFPRPVEAREMHFSTFPARDGKEPKFTRTGGGFDRERD